MTDEQLIAIQDRINDVALDRTYRSVACYDGHYAGLRAVYRAGQRDGWDRGHAVGWNDHFYDREDTPNPYDEKEN